MVRMDLTLCANTDECANKECPKRNTEEIKKALNTSITVLPMKNECGQFQHKEKEK